MSGTKTQLLEEWEDDDGAPNDEWPYATRYTKHLITGGLADAVRKRLELPDSTSVMIEEQVVSGGWSEYTQENDYNFTLKFDDGTPEVEFTSARWGYGIDNGLTLLIEWLDEED